MKVKKIRKKIQDIAWLKKKLDYLTEKAHEWHTFKTFDCSEFFRGTVRANYNLKIYEKEYGKVLRHIAFVEKLIDEKQKYYSRGHRAGKEFGL